MKKTMALLLLLLASSAYAFNPVQDVLENTYWTIGQTAAAGTAVNLRNGNYTASELAEIATYRMFSTWYGGTEVSHDGGATFTMTDTFKIGLNMNWFFSKFTHALPDQAKWLNNLVVGPSFAFPIFSTPHVGTPFFDINYRFGGNTPVPTTQPKPADSPTAALEHDTGIGNL